MTQHEDPYDDETEPAEPTYPTDLAAEQAVLGAMLISDSAISDADEILKPEHYYRGAHGLIHQAILSLHGAPGGEQPDPITVAKALEKQGDLVRCGGPGYLHTLVHNVPTAANAQWYADIVRSKYTLRRLTEIGERLASMARAKEAEPEEVLDAALGELQALLADAAGGDTQTMSVADEWEPFIDELSAKEDPRALDSPWPDLNEVVQFKPKELTVVGAGTGGGKSLFAMNLAAHIALKKGLPVLVASLEMGRRELLARLTAAEAGVELSHLVRRQVTDDDWDKIARVDAVMRGAHNFILDDSPSLTVEKIRARVRWMHGQGTPPGMVLVDYLQLISPSPGGSAGGNRTQEVAGISRGLKRLAHEFDVPVVALAQFNRGAVGRQPLVTDFKDSSQIEQDASVIVLLHRELAADGSDTGPTAGKVLLIVGKNRNGGQGKEIWLSFQGRFGRLRSLATSWTPGAAA
jgi:replicative DNA helicase